MASQNPRIIDIMHPTKLPNGGYIWLVKFELPTPAALNGWIVQEFFKIIAHSQGGDPRPRSYRYWEAWPVRRGSKEITDPYYRATWGGVAQQYNDIFGDRRPSNSIPTLSAGEIIVQAAARFYEVNLPPAFVKQMPGSLGLALPSTFIKPSFWGGSGSFRYVYYAWDFTGGPPHPILRTATKANANVFAGSIQTPAGARTWR
jgi:hypothetical protein